jgi:lantibiotic modifying enzyme
VAPVRERLAALASALVSAGATAPLEPREAARLLVRPLALELAEICGPSVALELQATRAAGALAGENAQERAAGFLRGLGRAERTRELLDEHPALGRLLYERLRLGEEAMSALLERLCADWSALRQGLLAGPAPGPLCDVVPLGDPHDGGHRVTALEFHGGARVLYKPRSLAGEAAYAAVLDGLQTLGLDPPVHPPAALVRGHGHGWQAWVEPHDVTRRRRSSASTRASAPNSPCCTR